MSDSRSRLDLLPATINAFMLVMSSVMTSSFLVGPALMYGTTLCCNDVTTSVSLLTRDTSCSIFSRLRTRLSYCSSSVIAITMLICLVVLSSTSLLLFFTSCIVIVGSVRLFFSPNTPSTILPRSTFTYLLASDVKPREESNACCSLMNVSTLISLFIVLISFTLNDVALMMSLLALHALINVLYSLFLLIIDDRVEILYIESMDATTVMSRPISLTVALYCSHSTH